MRLLDASRSASSSLSAQIAITPHGEPRRTEALRATKRPQ
jgi:hypothetical protein